MKTPTLYPTAKLLPNPSNPRTITKHKLDQLVKSLRDFPAMKPIELLARALQHASHPGDVVLDLFLGSGSTMVAAQQLGRKCYGVELEPTYCAVILRRMRRQQPHIKITKNGQEYQVDESGPRGR